LWKILHTKGWLSHGASTIGIVHPTHRTHSVPTNPKKIQNSRIF
jgi:hypothetical protein